MKSVFTGIACGIALLALQFGTHPLAAQPGTTQGGAASGGASQPGDVFPPGPSSGQGSGSSAAAGAAPGDQSAGQADRELAQLLIIPNQQEVSLGQFAQQKSQNDRVKKFAAHMIHDHTQLIQSLQRIAGNAGASAMQGGATPDQASQPRFQASQPRFQGNQPGFQGSQTGQAGFPGGMAQGQSGIAGPGQSGGGAWTQSPTAQSRTAGYAPSAGLDPVQVAQDVSKQLEPLVRNELDRQKGADFDKAYIGQQISGHLEMLAHLKAFRGFASPQLQQVIDHAIPQTQEHLNEANSIMQQLASAQDKSK